MNWQQLSTLVLLTFWTVAPPPKVPKISLQSPGPVQSEIECGCEDNPTMDILAIVNGAKIRRDDLSVDTRSKIRLLQDSLLEARNRELDKVIAATLLEAAAKSRGLTSRKLLQIEVTGKVVPPTDEEAEQFYKQNRKSIGKDFKDAKPGILAAMRTEREVQEAQKFANALRVAANVKILVERITPPANELERKRIVATVNGFPITSGDIEDGLAPLIYQVKLQTYRFRKTELDLKINDMLLDQEAKRQGVTPLALVSREVSGKLPIITDQQLFAFYNENRAQFGEEFSKVKLQIVQYLLTQEQQRLANSYAEQLRSRAAIQIFLRPPSEPSYKISIENQPSLGSDDAAVTVVEFTDFESPACAVVFPILKQLIAEFGAQVRFVVRDFPQQYKDSVRAAEAAEAAFQQGRYWEYVAMLYQNSGGGFELDRLKKFASATGLDRKKFDEELDSGIWNDQVQMDIADANKIGVIQAPAFFVNGRRTNGNSYGALKSAIQKALQ